MLEPGRMQPIFIQSAPGRLWFEGIGAQNYGLREGPLRTHDASKVAINQISRWELGGN